MDQREQVEAQIREVLASETTAGAVSRRLFHPTGLFAQLAATEAERRLVAQSVLFHEAQRRLSDLQRREAAAFAEAVSRSQPPIPNSSQVVQLLEVPTVS